MVSRTEEKQKGGGPFRLPALSTTRTLDGSGPQATPASSMVMLVLRPCEIAGLQNRIPIS